MKFVKSFLGQTGVFTAPSIVERPRRVTEPLGQPRLQRRVGGRVGTSRRRRYRQHIRAVLIPATTRRQIPESSAIRWLQRRRAEQSYENHQSPDPSLPGNPISPAWSSVVAPTGLSSLDAKNDGSAGPGTTLAVDTGCSV